MKSVDSLDPAFVQSCLDRAQRGDGELFAHLFRDEFFYEPNANEWYYWTGHTWAIDMENKHLAAVDRVAQAYLAAADRCFQERRALTQTPEDKRRDGQLKRLQEAFLKRGRQLRTADARRKALEFAVSIENPLITTADRLDQHPLLIGTPNGVINLELGDFEEGKPGQFITKATAVKWAGFNAPCSTWERILIEIFNGDTQVPRYLQRVIGYALTGKPNRDVVFFLVGRGRNGKSLIAKTLVEVLAPYAATIQSETLLAGVRRAAGSPNPEILRLRGLRLAFASETDEGAKVSGARLKLLSGGDHLIARAPFGKREIQFRPSHTLFLSTNAAPRIPLGGDYAIWQRLKVIPFPLSFVERRPDAPFADDERPVDPELAENLKKEYPGILAWCVNGALDYLEEGFGEEPDAVKNATNEYRRREDHLTEFIEFALVRVDNETIQASELYRAFQVWWERTRGGSKPWSAATLGNLLHDRNFQKKKSGGLVHYLDLALTSGMREMLDAAATE